MMDCSNTSENIQTCADACDVSYTDSIGAWAKRKVDRWIEKFDSLDYDAPGTSAREAGI